MAAALATASEVPRMALALTCPYWSYHPTQSSPYRSGFDRTHQTNYLRCNFAIHIINSLQNSFAEASLYPHRAIQQLRVYR